MLRSLPLALLSIYAVLAFLVAGCGQTQTQQPDFAFTVTPVASIAQPGTGDAETLSFTVVNNFFQDFSGMPYSVFDLSSASPTTAIFTSTVTSFGPNAVVPLTATIPAPSLPGTHTYSVVLDPGHVVAESDEANNTANITLVYANGDLLFGSQTVGVSPAPPTSDTVQLTFVVNYQPTSTSAGTLTGVPYSVLADGVPVFIGSLPALTVNSSNIVQTAILPHIEPGTHIYTITIDQDNLVPESHEDNNVLTSPPVDVAAPSAPG